MKQLLLTFGVALLLTGCGSDTGTNTSTADNTTNNTKTMASETYATIETSMGNIKLKLEAEKTPKTVENFVGLSKAGKYDKTIFHRVIKGFMLQAGDFTNHNGTGGDSIWGGSFEDEFDSTLTHEKGVISMANRGPATNTSQFFITHVETPHLDGRHTVFGQVVSNMSVIDRIARIRTDLTDRPIEPIVIQGILAE